MEQQTLVKGWNRAQCPRPRQHYCLPCSLPRLPHPLLHPFCVPLIELQSLPNRRGVENLGQVVDLSIQLILKIAQMGTAKVEDPVQKRADK